MSLSRPSGSTVLENWSLTLPDQTEKSSWFPRPRYADCMTDRYTFLANLIAGTAIPPEGTLSKVVFKDDRIRVVVFAFDEGEELTEHTASLPAIVQVLSGRLRLTMGEETVEAAPGDWAHMKAGLPHSVEALEPSLMLLTLLKAGAE